MILKSLKTLTTMTAVAAISQVTAQMQRAVYEQLPENDGTPNPERDKEIMRLVKFRRALEKVQTSCRNRFEREAYELEAFLQE